MYVVELTAFRIGLTSKRSAIQKRPDWMQKRLIMSSKSAEALCSSETSWGPDLVGSDGKFCDMETKTLSPICGSGPATEDCIVVDAERNHTRKRTSIARRAIMLPHKSYSAIERWA